MIQNNEKARPAGSTAERAKREKQRTSGNSHTHSTTNGGAGQAGIAGLLMAGAENGLHLKELSQMLGIDPRIVRQMIHQERRRGVPILSNSKDGYYLPGNEYEKAECVRQMRGRAKEIMAAAAGIERSEVGQ